MPKTLTYEDSICISMSLFVFARSIGLELPTGTPFGECDFLVVHIYPMRGVVEPSFRHAALLLQRKGCLRLTIIKNECCSLPSLCCSCHTAVKYASLRLFASRVFTLERLV